MCVYVAEQVQSAKVKLLLLSAFVVSNPLSAKRTDVSNYAVLIHPVGPVSRSTLRG